MKKLHKKRKPNKVSTCSKCHWQNTCNTTYKGTCKSFMEKIDLPMPKLKMNKTEEKYIEQLTAENKRQNRAMFYYIGGAIICLLLTIWLTH